MEAMISDHENSQGNSSAHQQLTLGRGPFQRDPGSAAAVAMASKSMAESSNKFHPQVLLLLNKGLKIKAIDNQSCSSLGNSASLEEDKPQAVNKAMSNVKMVALDEQCFSSCGDLAAPEEDKNPSSSGIVGLKRKAEAWDTSSNEKANKHLQNKWLCSICGISATSEKGFNDHLQGKKHKNKEASSKFNDPTLKISSECNSNRLYCSLCQKYIPSEKRLKVHLEGRKHKAKETRFGKHGEGYVQIDAMDINSATAWSKQISDGDFQGRNHEAERVSCQENDDMGCLSYEEVSGKIIMRYENPKEERDFNRSILDLGKQEEIKEGTTKELRVLKSWHCQMCDITYNDEESMAAHRRGSEHMSLLLKHRGGVIVVSRIPEEEELDEGGVAAEEQATQEALELVEATAARSTSLENRQEIQEIKQENINTVGAEKY